MVTYDYIIIGAGIAGLYSAYTIRKENPTAKIIIFEKDDHVGGRTMTTKFEGVDVVCGAGVGRKNKDYLLRELISDLNVPTHEFYSTHKYTDKIEHKLTVWLKSLKAAAHNTVDRMSFKRFASEVLGQILYSKFVKAIGYTDFEKTDYNDVLKYYGLDDSMKSWTGIHIPWNILINNLVDYIGKRTIHLNTGIKSIKNISDEYVECKTTHGEIYAAKKCIVATTIESIRKFFPDHEIYNDIEGQPFLRVYAQFKSSLAIEAMKEKVTASTIVGPPIEKIIPIAPDRGIYMICYADNACALKIKEHLRDIRYLEEKVATSLDIPIEKLRNSIVNIQSHFWHIGTHYNKPLRAKYKNRAEFIRIAQRPVQNIYVVGEVVALHQGWVEGALESVLNARWSAR
jgi:hypothetical protein